MEYKNIQVEVKEGVRLIRISKENKLNPLDVDTLKEIRDAVGKTEGPAIISGSEKAFSAGANIKAFSDLKPEIAYHFATEGHDVMDFISTTEHIVIAAVRNYALGGGFELALACDFRVANREAKLGLTEATLGIIPGWGGTQRLRDLVGSPRALLLASRGKMISGEEAHSLGVVDFLSEDPEAEAFSLAKEYVGAPGKAVGYIKTLIRSRSPDSYEYEKEAFGKIFETDDAREGVKAFLEKRKPVFRSR
ncbi:MAG: enoyl-CoA hydratase/isomerase family protein [Candidatus Thermoplasmatota archaeon]|jgi:enoyl-CoA hydratase/carnithine racemase|nr:enoyl-CoA hydratase/isomerase family protein [Candidatus Thermoplasmatota archaeon]